MVLFILFVYFYWGVLFVVVVGFEGFEFGFWLYGFVLVFFLLCGFVLVFFRLIWFVDLFLILGLVYFLVWMIWGGGWCLEIKGKYSKIEILDNVIF